MTMAVPLPDPTRCIARQSVLPMPAGSAVHSCLLELKDPQDLAFDIAQFKAAGMAIPEQIGRSVLSRQAEFFHGRWAARMALLQAFGATPAPPDARVDSHDQQQGEMPSRLDSAPPAHTQDIAFDIAFDIAIGSSREPLWPANIVGSLTHCHGFAAAAVARAPALQALGIDIERVATGESLQALRTSTLNEAELRLLHAREPALPAPVLITLAFSAKESLFKAAFPTVQRYFDFDAARVVNLSPSLHKLTLELTENLGPGLRAGDQIRASYRLIRPDVVFTTVSW